MKKLTEIGLVLLIEAALYGLFVAILLAEGAPALSLVTVTAFLVLYSLRRFAKGRERVMGLFQENRVASLLILVLLSLSFPILMRKSPYWIFVLTLAALYAIVALGLNLQLGSTGLINLAGAAFYGIGAYTVGLLTVKVHASVWLSLVAGPLMAALVGILLFIPILKTKGHYLALVTIAFGFIFHLLMNNMEWTGGPQGIKNIPTLSVGAFAFTTPPRLAGLVLPYHANFFWLTLAFVGGVAFLAARLSNSWVGLTLNTIRDDEIAAKCLGVDAARWKLIGFSLGNLIMGLAGSLYAAMVGYISPADFTFGDSLIMVGIVILGGMDSIPGVLLGAMLLIILPEKFRVLHDLRLIIYGMVIVAMLLFRPRGILPSQVRRYGLKVEGGRWASSRAGGRG